MKQIPTTLASLLAVITTSHAYPGMGRLLAELQNQQLKDRAPAGFLGSTQILGDLNNLPDSSLTTSGAAIKAILSGDGQPLGDAGTIYTAPGPLESPSCAADKCCAYKYAALSLTTLFKDASGECNQFARQALRLGFHDSGTWETSMGYGSGGADGSVLLNPTEMARADNLGLEPVALQIRQLYGQLHAYNASMADLIQLAAMTAVVSCPGGPRMRFFAGRVDNANPATDGLLPQPTQSPEALVALFQRKSFTPGGLAVLLGAHTISQQFRTAPAQSGASQDVTPGVWDNGFYNTTVAPGTPAGVYKLPSDVALSQHEGTAASFQFFATAEGRRVWQSAFAAEYLRVSLLGVYNMNQMVDCTNVLPLSTFTG